MSPHSLLKLHRVSLLHLTPLPPNSILITPPLIAAFRGFGVPTRYFIFFSRIYKRLSSLTIPLSITHTPSAYPYFFSIISTISLRVVTSVRLPSKTSKESGNPSRLTPLKACPCRH